MWVFSRSRLAIDGTNAFGSRAFRLTASTADTTCGSGRASQRFVGSVCPVAAVVKQTLRSTFSFAVYMLIAWFSPLIVKFSQVVSPVTGQVVLTSGGGELNRYKSGTPVTLERICGHRDGDATECPGNALYAQLPELRRRAAE